MSLTIVSNLGRILLRLLGYGLPAISIAGVIVYVNFLAGQPDLSIWHHADLDQEFTQDSDVFDFSQYLELENRLFQQLDDLVYAEAPQDKKNIVNRFSRGSLSDPELWPVNWNRIEMNT